MNRRVKIDFSNADENQYIVKSLYFRLVLLKRFLGIGALLTKSVLNRLSIELFPSLKKIYYIQFLPNNNLKLAKLGHSTKWNNS